MLYIHEQACQLMAKGEFSYKNIYPECNPSIKSLFLVKNTNKYYVFPPQCLLKTINDDDILPLS